MNVIIIENKTNLIIKEKKNGSQISLYNRILRLLDHII